GEGEEVYEPRFTFHGFRYVEVTGYPGTPGRDAITGIVVHSNTPPSGTFACSSPMVNQLQHNIVWGQRGNYLEVPTDCPQRDERLGWMGDAQIFVRTGTYNMDTAAFMTKWVQDVEDAQSPEGAYSDISPRVKDDMADGAPGWGDAGVIVPWTLYAVYDDTRLIERHYESMARWIDTIHAANPNLLWENRRNNDFGDWLNIQADMPRDVMATAYFAYDAHLLAQMAQALGKEEDAQKYVRLFEGIRDAFVKAFVGPDGRIKGDTQTGYVLALRFDLLPENLRPLAAQHLVENIQQRDGHLSTGFIGVGYLLPTLTRTGHLDVAYRLLNNDTFPSWGYSIKHGATTIWERWDGWTEEKGFQDPGMNSFNHYSLGSVGEWLYETVAGIDLDPDQPGYKHIIMHPQPGGGLTWAKATYDSLRGPIASDWKLDNGTFAWKVTIPANTTATVYVPASDAASVTESGHPADQAEGVRFLRMEDHCAVYELGSGEYTFTGRSRGG
ncbi:MAG TPA: family 78 glycoside hydrolase catalytic domain, partial [Chthonomonadaceae bacterium]|nr:family 78 glycoside hydrolase catalytic domain [Chthonomonadaceae bacterium]